MALLAFAAGTPYANAKVVESRDRQRRRTGTGGAPPTWQYRDIERVTVTWPCDASGGEFAEVPTTYVNSLGHTCNLVSQRPQLSYEQPTGNYTAVYEYDSGW